MYCCDNISNLILNLASDDVLLSNSGGKAENLSKLKQLGYNVPNGFIITTDVYDKFIDSNKIRMKIDDLLKDIDYENLDEVGKVSKRIRDIILFSPVPEEIKEDFLNSYGCLGQNLKVAVRSSATMEDLPGMSFAGQQDTFLNIQNENDLIQSIISCWSSLWTKRAILYRYKNKVNMRKFSIAVIVQEMIDSEFSGVTFTINPLNGYKMDIVIEVVKGIGELLVSGQVEPQQYILDKNSLKIKSLKLQSGEKGQFLTEKQINEMGKIAKKIEQDFGGPQDIEWAFKDDKLSILQTRPITNYYPIPKGFNSQPTHIFGSFGAVQGILDPISPLGREILKVLLLGVGNIFGANWNLKSQKILYNAGERLWFDLTPIITTSLRDKIIDRLSQFADPGIGQIIDEIQHEFDVKAISKKVRVKFLLVIGRILPKILYNIVKTLKNPIKSKESYRNFLSKIVQENYSEIIINESSKDEFELLKSELKNIIKISEIFPAIIPKIAGPILTYSILLVVIRKLYDRFLTQEKGELFSVLLSEGLKDTVTTNMGIELLNIAKNINNDKNALELFDNNDKKILEMLYIENKIPHPFQIQIKNFINKYGVRSIGEFDIGRTRWSEEPSYVIQMIKSNLEVIKDKSKSSKLEKSELISSRKLQQLEFELYNKSRIKLPYIFSKKMRYIVQNIMGVREDHKFMMINVFAILRSNLLKIGSKLVDRGFLDKKDDLFFLELHEIKRLSKLGPSISEKEIKELKKIIADRKEINILEKNRLSIPKIILSDGRMFHGSSKLVLQPGMKTIKGQPVSSGIVKGKVRIIFDPSETTIKKGEILVCRGTDPAWTPLFLIASGVIMEVGGMMTHGAVVAREYGIPGIVGIAKATEFFKNGQEIEMNGFTGTIQILD